MPTSIHLPKPILDAVDRRARALKISRNKLILQAVQRELEDRSDWSPGFFEELARTDEDAQKAVDQMLEEIRRRRTSKKAPRL